MLLHLSKVLLQKCHLKMDAVAVETVLADAKINYDSSRILFKHLIKNFGESYFSSEKERLKDLEIEIFLLLSAELF